MISIHRFALAFLLIFNGVLSSESILIQNATIYDGKDNDGFIGNVLIEDNKIARVTTTNLRGDVVIDVSYTHLTLPTTPYV